MTGVIMLAEIQPKTYAEWREVCDANQLTVTGGTTSDFCADPNGQARGVWDRQKNRGFVQIPDEKYAEKPK